MDEYSLFPEECNLNFLDDDDKQEFLSHDIDTVFQEQNQQQCLNSETTFNNSFTDETNFESFDFAFERPTIDHNENFTAETISLKLSPSSSISSFQSQILSFENLPNSPATNTPHFYEFDPTTLNSNQNEIGSVSLSLHQTENTHVFTQTPKGSPKNQNFETKTSQPKRSRANAEDHIMAERKRREILSQSFIALAALVPNLKKVQ
ncbi:hypothetical protein KIW84_042442 [Lathyrus oleraceus]|uniref:BHLH domain-containing protein n=1 Tax=Pisum sativum TaxID=3888 RepID=A0A9D4XCH5_PEA|nr:hypothetical protein KIW84_042442 [Pisum sativum]